MLLLMKKKIIQGKILILTKFFSDLLPNAATVRARVRNLPTRGLEEGIISTIKDIILMKSKQKSMDY